MRELLELRPSILQRDRPVPHLLLSRGIRIERKIAETLELIALLRPRARKRRLAFRGYYFERVRIDERFEIAARACRAGASSGGGIGLGNSEEPIIQSDFRIDGVRLRLPSESCL